MKWLIFLLCVPFAVKSQMITTFGGGSTSLGDGGPATAALISDPAQLNFDTKGNMYIACGVAKRVRKIDTSGIITTVAGTGAGGYSGDHGPATAARFNFLFGVVADSGGNIFVADGLYGAIRRIDAMTGIITTICGNDVAGYSGDGGPATAAKLNGVLAFVLIGQGICILLTATIMLSAK